MQRTQQKHVHLAAALALALAAWGCGSSGGTDGGAEVDAGAIDAGSGADDGGRPDAGDVDAGTDAGPDAGTDAGTDGGAGDGGVDAGPDGGLDGGLDGGEPDGGGDGGLDAGTDDGGTDGGTDAGFEAAPLGTGPLYDPDRVHSPMTPEVAAGLRQVVDDGPTREQDVFAKVGDSISTGDNFMFCFADPAAVDLDGRSLQDTIDWFMTGDADGTTPYERNSLATFVGALTVQIGEVYTDEDAGIVWDPPRLEQEIDAVSPQFAPVMLGTNDLGSRPVADYARDLWNIVDHLLDEGVVPLLSTIPPREDTDTVARAGPRVPLFNAVVRGLAQGRRVPLVDYHQVMMTLPDHGLGPDRIHPSEDWSVGTCDFTATGLAYGWNQRNLLTIQALDRARRAVLEDEDLQDTGETIVGDGTASDPIRVPKLPFGNMRDLYTQGTSSLGSLSACGSATATGPGLVYRFELTEGGALQAGAFPGPGSAADVQVRLLDASRSSCPSTDTCSWSDRNDPDHCLRSYWLPAGAYELVVQATTTPADAAEVLVAIVQP